jgi:hypothetical protein
VKWKKGWRHYQVEVRDFLRTLDLNAETDVEIEGVRARHRIDIWVIFERHGLDHRWAVECKYWKARIPKEKVLTLQAVVQDIGADRGLLMSESGFQAGAVRATEKTNIVLTSLDELRAGAQDYLRCGAIEKMHQRIAKVEGELAAARDRLEQSEGPPPYEGAFWVPEDEYMRQLGSISMIDRALKRALRDEFPTVTGPDETGKRPRLANNLSELVDQAGKGLDIVEAYLSELEKRLG